MVLIALELVIQHFLSTPEVRVCKHKGGWGHECAGCLEDAKSTGEVQELVDRTWEVLTGFTPG